MAISTVSNSKEGDLMDLPPSYFQLFGPLPPPYSSVQNLSVDFDSQQPSTSSSMSSNYPSAPPYYPPTTDENGNINYNSDSTPIRQPLASQNGRSDSVRIQMPEDSASNADDSTLSRIIGGSSGNSRSNSRAARGSSRGTGSRSRSRSRSRRSGNGNNVNPSGGAGSVAGSVDSLDQIRGTGGKCCKGLRIGLTILILFVIVVYAINRLTVSANKNDHFHSYGGFDNKDFNSFNLNIPAHEPPFHKNTFDNDLFLNWVPVLDKNGKNGKALNYWDNFYGDRQLVKQS